MKLPVLDQADLRGKRVLLRAGFDVPIENGVVQDTTRIEAIVSTMRFILDSGASLIIMAHQARPKGERVPEMSQKPLVPVLEKLLEVSVHFADKCDGEDTRNIAENLQPGEVLLLENLRYEKGEKSKDASKRDALGKTLASFADVYVNDAFTNCHRDHASMTSVPKFLQEKYMGLNVQKEVEGLSRVTEHPAKPVLLIISGLKMETKIPVIRQFLDQGQDILVGGGVANTLLVAQGIDMQKSKVDEEFVNEAREILDISSQEENATIHLPQDGICASDPSGATSETSIDAIPNDCAVFDVGPATIQLYTELIAAAKTIVWNGPMGMYEEEKFASGTKAIATAVREATLSGAVSIIGGGDTLDFHDKYNISLESYTFVSTAGGAMLDFISGKQLPALEALIRD